MRISFDRFGQAVAVMLLLASPLHAATDPQNMGSGLDKLVESRAITKADSTRAIYRGYATQQAASFAAAAITDASGSRVLVDIVPTGRLDVDALIGGLQRVAPSFAVGSVDKVYRGVGMIEAYISVDDAVAVAKTAGVKSVFLATKPYLKKSVPLPSVQAGDHLYKIGTAFDQGVVQHRVDRISQIYNPAAPVNYDGAGISVGILSDNYDKRAASPHAAQDVANFDVPGAPTNPWNTQPVVVLEDSVDPPLSDEGRGMVQIVYKMAPRARVAFATANGGQLAFANNIRALAALPGFEKPPAVQKGFKADVIADDEGYFDEPWYEDGIINNAVDDVAAAGVSYFSSAGNDIGTNGYESPLRVVSNGSGFTAATNSALVGTNIDLTPVPARFYAGGFHNFNPNGLDVAQLVNYTGAQWTVLQWDDPFDSSALTLNQPPIYSTTGNSTGGASVTFDGNSTPPLPMFTQGTPYQIQETADTANGNFDAVMSVFDPSGNLVLTQDTGTDETVVFFAPVTGVYRIVVAPFVSGGVPTAGPFSFVVNTGQGSAGVTSDFNLLVFDTAGVYQPDLSLTSNNLADNRPLEFANFAPNSGNQLQFVIARGNTPTAPAAQLPTRVRWLIEGNGAGGLGPAEYFSYNTVTTGGHPTAVGANGTAAYSVFKPTLPETFTSPGPATFMFDKNSVRLATPEIRQQPRVAAADNANTSGFFGDVTNDLDTNPNFSGTSAAAPHAAAIAALVLQSRGGSGSVTPAQMTSILQASAFPHDLDPSAATGTAVSTDGGTVAITINSDGDANTATGGNDPSSIKIAYAGAGSIASITFNPAGSDVAGGNVTGGNSGVQDDVGSLPLTVNYFDNSFPGLTFLPFTKAFTLGTLTSLTAADIVQPGSVPPFAGFSNLAPAPANGTTQFRTMTIGFPNANFGNGAAVSFTVGRGAQHSSITGNGTTIGPGTVTLNPIADLFGGGVSIPAGIVSNNGMAFSGTTSSGGTFSGTIKNQIGKGYSVVDGFGFIDASVATSELGATGSATPASAYRAGTTVLTVKVTPGTSPTSTNLSVVANLSSIGGSSAQAFHDDGLNGDAVAGDNIFSFNATVGASALAGNKSIPVAISDAQSRTGLATIAFAVLAPVAPLATGLASPNSVATTQSSLLTVSVTPGVGPVSTGIAVKADLSSIGGSATQAFLDNGLNGDVMAGDGIYSFNATVPLNTAPGAKTLPVTVTDTQLRTASTSIALTVLTPTSPTGVASASPNSASIGGSTLFTVVVTGGNNPASTSTTVKADLSSIGGGATQALFDDGTNGDAIAGDGTYSFLATVAAGTTSGPKILPFTLTDAQGRTSSTSVGFNVASANGPSGTGLSTPTNANLGDTITLIVSVTPGSNPASTGLTVVVDLSSIGGSATQTFYDDASNGDQVAGDNIFSFTTTVPTDAVGGTKTFAATITDTQLRSGSATIQLNVVDEIFANGFE